MIEHDQFCLVFFLCLFMFLLERHWFQLKRVNLTCVCFIFSLICCLCSEKWFNWIDFDLFSFFVVLFVFPLVVVERTMSWLVEQDGARIFLPLSNVCQRQNEKQSAKLTRTIAVLCFRFVFIFLFSSQQHQ